MSNVLHPVRIASLVCMMVMMSINAQVVKVPWVSQMVRGGQVVELTSFLNQGSQSTVFNDLVSSYSRVVVDFSAKWCGPCKAMKPILEQLAAEMPDVLFIIVDVDQCKELSKRFGVSSMPTFMFFKNGSRVNRVVGSKPKDQFRQMINSL